MKKDMFAKVKCAICGEEAHFIESHLRQVHPPLTLEGYKSEYPDAEILSVAAKATLKRAIDEANTEFTQVDVKKLFGVNLPIKTVKAFREPKESTPAIDSHYVFNPVNLSICLYGLSKNKEKVLFTGPTGSGKSSIVEQVAARLNWGFCRINFDSDITRSDLIGQWVLRGDKMEFQYGLLVRAMIEGDILLLDEWDTVNPGVAMLLQPVLEGKNLTITETGEVIEPNDNFRAYATCNTIGQGDTTGLYNGTQPQNFAALDRFSVVGVVEYPSEEIERVIIEKKTGLDDKTIIKKLLSAATLIRKAFVNGETMATMSTRTVINIAEKLIDFGAVKFVYQIAFLNKLNQDDQNFCAEILQRVYGAEYK